MYEDLGGRRFEQPRHVLDRENVGPGRFDLLCQIHVVGQVVALPTLVQNVSGVTKADLGNLSLLPHRVDRHLHVRQPVQGVENAEDVDSRIRSFFHEQPHGVVGIRRIADEALTPQKHLEEDVWNALTQLRQPLPRIFLQETIRGVEGRSAPDLHGKEVRREAASISRDPEQVEASHASGEQRLVRVAECRIGEEYTLVISKMGH